MAINLHIDQLILHGFERLDRHQLGTAVQTELSRLIHEQGMPSSLNKTRTIRNLNAGEFKMGKATGSNIVGAKVAQKIYRGMER